MGLVKSRLCKCGCGTNVYSRDEYRRGHRPRRLWNVVDRGHSTLCWVWLGWCNARGYAMKTLRLDNEKPIHRRVHRLMYEDKFGPVPDGLVLDHLCGVRNCVNPDHLEPVTNQENLKRGVGPSSRLAKIFCMSGRHRMIGHNIRKTPSGQRCRACENETRRRRAEMKRRAA